MKHAAMAIIRKITTLNHPPDESAYGTDNIPIPTYHKFSTSNHIENVCIKTLQENMGYQKVH